MIEAELIAALEKAEGPDRNLDTAIVLAIHPEAHIGLYCEGDMEPLVFHAEPLVPQKHELPHFTASIDAALTLVPEGWTWHIWSNDDGLPAAELTKRPFVIYGFTKKPTLPAIALCIASLKARAHQRADTPNSPDEGADA